MNAYAIAKEFFPDLPDDVISFILWDHTGYPQFWNIPEDGDTPEECLRKQLKEYQDSRGD